MGESDKALDYVEGQLNFDKISQETLQKYIESGGLETTPLEEEFRDNFQKALKQRYKSEKRSGNALGILNYAEEIYGKWKNKKDLGNDIDFIDRNAKALGKRLTGVHSWEPRGDSIVIFETPEDVTENRYLTISYEKDIFDLAKNKGIL